MSFTVGAVIVAFVTTLADLYGEGPAGFMNGLSTAVAVNILSIGVTQYTSAAHSLVLGSASFRVEGPTPRAGEGQSSQAV